LDADGDEYYEEEEENGENKFGARSHRSLGLLFL
jgi:hypothetical protein